ncbi:MAG: helix-hairpin-helix domain-containing protein, partial [Pseudomonadota bacterium]
MSRPEILFPLFSDLETLPSIGPKTAQNLAALHIEKPRDLLFHLPHSVIDRRPVTTVKGADLPATLTVEVTITSHRIASRKGAPHRIFVEDAGTTFQIVYFNVSGRFLENLLPVGQKRVVSGKVELFDGEANMV